MEPNPEVSSALPATRKKILLTGATGYIAGQLLPALRDRYDLRLIDVRTTNQDGETVPDVEVVDLLTADRATLEDLFRDQDVIIHTGYLRPRPDAVYEDERKNVDMMQRVFDVALTTGVPRVVAASTNQAAKWYEQPYYAGRLDRVTTEDYPRPDSFYGWAKAAYESLGFLYACGSLDRKLEVVLIRIVAPREIEAKDFADRPKAQYIRDLAGYVSARDLQQLFCKSVDTPDIDDPYGVPFHIFYGVSNNARTFWSITNAREVIDYQPEDDSEIRFAADIATLLG
jgi:hypothetical protein